jgi:hypothetical protein
MTSCSVLCAGAPVAISLGIGLGLASNFTGILAGAEDFCASPVSVLVDAAKDFCAPLADLLDGNGALLEVSGPFFAMAFKRASSPGVPPVDGRLLNLETVPVGDSEPLVPHIGRPDSSIFAVLRGGGVGLRGRVCGDPCRGVAGPEVR